jgi:hypothetical protein
MTATYTSPATSNTDWIRDKIGDIDPDSFFLTNEEIQAEITANGNLYLAAANCAFKCTTRMGEYEALANLFEKRGNQLLKEAHRNAGFTSVVPSVGIVTDAGTQPHDYDVSGEKPSDWSLNEIDMPSQVRRVDIV